MERFERTIARIAGSGRGSVAAALLQLVLSLLLQKARSPAVKSRGRENIDMHGNRCEASAQRTCIRCCSAACSAAEGTYEASENLAVVCKNATRRATVAH